MFMRVRNFPWGVVFDRQSIGSEPETQGPVRLRSGRGLDSVVDTHVSKNRETWGTRASLHWE